MKTTREFLKSLRALVAAAPAEDETPGHALALAAGEPTVVECARSGVFVDMHGTRIEFSPEVLGAMAAGFDPAEEHKVKIGHKAIETDTPDYGNVTALAYDEKRDRLLATIVPTPITVRKNREEGFRRTSLEARRQTKADPWNFEHLALLGARRPGVDQLGAVELAAAQGEEGVAIFLEGVGEDDVTPNEPLAEVLVSTKPIDKSATVSPEADPKPKDEGNHMEPTAELAAAKATADRFRKQIAEGAADRAKSFVAANQRRIPLAAMKAGIEPGLAAMLAAEAEAETPMQVQFAGADGKPVVEAPSAFLMRILAALPEQTTPALESETAKDGVEPGGERVIEAAGALDAESVDRDTLILAEQAAAKSRGESISYLEAYRNVERSRARA